MTMNQRESHDLDELLQEYLDGDLEGPAATRLLLDAQKDPKVSARLRLWRRLFTLLDETPREEPRPGFDARILEAVPYERYASGPRRVWPSLVLGAHPSLWVETATRRLRSGMGAVFAAYLLFLVVSRSVLQSGASQLARWLQQGLGAVADASASIPVLSAVAGWLDGAWSRAVDLVVGAAHALGPGVFTVLVGAGLGLFLLAVVGSGDGRSRVKGKHA